MSGLPFSTDMPYWGVATTAIIILASLVLVFVETKRHPRGRVIVVLSALLALFFVAMVALRPMRTSQQHMQVGPKVAVLVDTSVSMQLPGSGASRIRVAAIAAQKLKHLHPKARMSFYSFGVGPAKPLDMREFDSNINEGAGADQLQSDLTTALLSITESPENTPDAFIVISDGRLDAPLPASLTPHAASASMLPTPRSVPIHGVWVASEQLADASIRDVQTAGAAVAHQPITLSITVGCTGKLTCDSIPVTVRELGQSSASVKGKAGGQTPFVRGQVKIVDGVGKLTLPLTLNRIGTRIVKVAIQAPNGDEISENNERYITFDVTRDRVRILHIAGRPTYDVRAMRQWLTSDGSLDVVTFFILRSLTDDVNAHPDDLALIRFPVDELFTEHLSSFDVVVLQDFDALSYGLSPYLSNVATYIKQGGGLVMIGGINGFSAGNYASTPIEEVLPVKLVASQDQAIDAEPFEPRYSTAGLQSPVLQQLRKLFADRLPTMSGVNVVADASAGAVVLWEHPVLKTPSSKAMPVLSLGQHENGRVIALGVDGTHHLAFGEFGVEAATRGYGALWDALLGWLMRESRYESARMETLQPCRAGAPTPVRLYVVGEGMQKRTIELTSLDAQKPLKSIVLDENSNKPTQDFMLPALPQGGYSIGIKIGQNPVAPVDFACETAGQEWADTRPDPDRLRDIAKQTAGKPRGVAVSSKDINKIKLPELAPITTHKRETPVAPPWLWALGASITLGIHWIVRRWAGLA